MSDHAVETEKRAAVEIVRLRAPGGTVAEIVPAWGGSCIAFRAAGHSVLEPVSLDEIAQKPTSYGIPILFPFPNRIRDGRFTFERREYRVDPPRHGVVRDKSWTVVGSGAGDPEGAWITVGLDAAAPFPFRIDVTYRLRTSALEIVAIARNTGERAVPTGFGVHPYFRAPEGGTVSVPAESRWELADSLPTGRVVAVEGKYDLRTPRAIEALELDDVYTNVTAGALGRARATIDDPEARRRTVIEFDPRSLPECVVFTPPALRKAICVEPQSCPTDAFNLAARGIDAHVVRLLPNAEVRWSIVIRNEPTD
jgi:aldose 1-epimerase